MHWTFTLTRRVRLVLETLLVLVLLTGAVLGWGVWRLSQGPLDLKPYLPGLTRAFNAWVPGISYTIGDASLEWGGQRAPFLLRLHNVDLISARGRQIGTVGDATLGLAPQALLAGQIAPTTIDIASPSLTVTRFPDGQVGLRFDRNATSAADTDNALTAKELIDLLRVEHYAFARYLQRIMISDITIGYRDFITQQDQISRNGRLLIERSAQNVLSGQGLLDLPVGDTLKTVTLDLRHNETNGLSIMTLRLPALSFPELQTLFPRQDLLTHLTGNLQSEIVASFDPHLRTHSITLAGKIDQGALVYPALFAQPLPVTTGQFSISYDLARKKLVLRDAAFVLPDATLGLHGAAQDPFGDKPVPLTLQAQLSNMPMGKLGLYWPPALASGAQNWVTTHITQGVADKALLNVQATLPAGLAVSPPASDGTSENADAKPAFTLDKLEGTIDFHGLNADYLPPMIPVTNIDGQAVFNRSEFSIVPTNGTLRDTRIKNGVIKIAPLDSQDTTLDMTLALDGPVHDALVLLSDKPLEFTQRVGIDPNNVSGRAETSLHLQFPLHHDLKLDQLSVKTAAILHDITVRHAYRDATLTGERMDLSVDGKGLTLHGPARLSDAVLQSLNWDEFFGPDTPLRRNFAIKGQATPQLLRDLHLDAGDMFAGTARIDTTIVEKQNRDTSIALSADLRDAAFVVPILNLDKKPGQPGAASFSLNAKSGQPARITDLDVTLRDLTLRKAQLAFAANGTLQSLSAPNLVAGRTRVSVTAKPLPRGSGWDATVKGRTLDLTGLKQATDQADPNAPRPLVRLALNADTVLLDADYPLSRVKGRFLIDNDVILLADLDATAGQTPLTLRFGPTNGGNRKLEMNSPNAGDVLRALGITRSVRGGKLVITGGSAAATPQQIKGHLTLTDFTMVKAPLLARLLNAFSFGGLLDLLNQSGLSFATLDTDFTHQTKTLIVKDGRMTGASLGLNFAGTIDQKTDRLDLGGTVVPLQGINRLASKIPLLGPLLTGLKGEGLVAATYRITGPTQTPSVSVNPLSVLTPGILRSIFFEHGD